MADDAKADCGVASAGDVTQWRASRETPNPLVKHRRRGQPCLPTAGASPPPDNRLLPTLQSAAINARTAERRTPINSDDDARPRDPPTQEGRGSPTLFLSPRRTVATSTIRFAAFLISSFFFFSLVKSWSPHLTGRQMMTRVRRGSSSEARSSGNYYF